jgi:thiamine pyrophosphate-dependent acetolactate synthase large subunit-like protein
MFEASKLLLDKSISRRTFIARMTHAGMAVSGATALANALVGQVAMANGTAPEQSRVLNNVTGGEVMVELLSDWKIPYVFGLAGSEEVGFLDALVDHPTVQYATCIHESVAMAMADGYSRSTGQTSIVQLHSVAGSAYALGQLVGSYRDRVPVVVVAGRQAVDFRGQDGFLEAENLHELPNYYAQWKWDVMSPDTISEVLRRAFMLAEAPPGGPTFMTFSKDLWEKKVERTEIIPRSRSLNNASVTPSDDHVSQIADNLINSQHPAIFLGNECIKYEISDDVAAISEMTGSLVFTANKIPVVFPNTHQNFGGNFLLERKNLKGNIDAFWSLGGPMFKSGSKPSEPLIDRSATIMHTSLAESDVGRNYPVDLAAIASIDSTSKAVLKELKGRNLKTSAIRDRKQWVEDFTTNRKKAIDEQAKKEWNSNVIAASRLFLELNDVMAKDAYVVSEVVSYDSMLRNYLDFDHKRPIGERRVNYDTTSGILGWGMPASIGVKMGNPDKEVWCLTSDGSLNFSIQALWSAARYEVPLPIVVFNNGQYQANRLNQNPYNGNMVRTQKYIGVSLDHPKIGYVNIANGYGIEAERVEDPAKLSAVLNRARVAAQEGRPYLVDVVVDTFGKGAKFTHYDFFSVAEMQKSTMA